MPNLGYMNPTRHLLFVYNYNIGLHVYTGTNYLPKYHSSPILSQVSTGIVAQKTGDPLSGRSA